ncbi:hypothetical protein GCM10010123_41070 [Pilimelia anulata]|uniref:Uncharacterized protein n=1 Tax=Pilimelia anulata TaxID=53371 RepID=A0A8J3BAT0_9ACTN|nr:hypothetical protein GCM10010123_41070 [Pilimelia anulata]
MHHLTVSGIARPLRGGASGVLVALVLVVGVLWMHGASTGHRGLPPAGHGPAAAHCPEDRGPHCPTEPTGHDGAACRVNLPAASAPVADPGPGTHCPASPAGEVRATVITADEAGAGSGRGPPSRAALSVLRI